MSDQLYDLSQGVVDIVVKLFALAQHRAIMTGAEQITPALLKQVYDDELIPAHLMLDALRSGNPKLIIKYGDLRMPDMTAQILTIIQDVNIFASRRPIALDSNKDTNSKLINVLCAMGMEYDIVVPLADKVLINKQYIFINRLLNLAISRMQNEKKPKSTHPPNIPRNEIGQHYRPKTCDISTRSRITKSFMNVRKQLASR